MSDKSTIVPATTADISQVIETLSSAFWDDPFMEFLCPKEPTKKRRAYHRVFAGVCQQTSPHGGLHTTADRQGAICWLPAPGKLSAGDKLGSLLLCLQAAGWRNFFSRLAVMASVEKLHPQRDCFYLIALGVTSQMQGRGLGSQLLRSMLDLCDERGSGAYLENAKEKNLSFYRRHGFEVLDTYVNSKHGLQIWVMWREPVERESL